MVCPEYDYKLLINLNKERENKTMKPTVEVVQGLTKETLKFELGGLIETIIENVYTLLEEDKEFDPKSLSTNDGDLIIQTVVDTVRSEMVNVDDYI